MEKGLRRYLMALGKIRKFFRSIPVALLYSWRWLLRFESDFLMIKRKGTIVSIGNASGKVPPMPPLKLAPKNLTLLRPMCVFLTSLKNSDLNPGPE
jgi:hypothetical protein